MYKVLTQGVHTEIFFNILTIKTKKNNFCMSRIQKNNKLQRLKNKIFPSVTF